MQDRLFLALYRSNDAQVRAAAIDKLNNAHYQAYGDASAPATLKYKWKTDNAGAYSMFASFEKIATSSLESHFRPKKGQTVIMQMPQDLDDSDNDDACDSRPAKLTLPGMVIPFLITNKGVAGYSW